MAALKLFAKQAVAVPPLGPVYPAFATHAVIAVEPLEAPEAELAGQPVHAVEPVTFLKVSAKQAVGVVPLEPVYPLSARQDDNSVAWAALCVCSGHAVHTCPMPWYPALHAQVCVPGPVWLHKAWSAQSSCWRLQGFTIVQRDDEFTKEPAQPGSHSQSDTDVDPTGLAE